ncbi:MAG TPA: DUF6790 family protein [Steroidobacteraceae bacterium]
MYVAIVTTFMLVLPSGFICLSFAFGGAALSAALIAKWFVIWSVGARLSLAGLRQIFQPRYTAAVILSLKHDESLVLVRELGFANLAIGLVGLGAWIYPMWITAAALAGAVFYSLAGLSHVLRPHRGNFENIAMVSDFFVGLVLAAALVSILL